MALRTVDREPGKHAACFETTPDFVHPTVVKLHPLGFRADHPGWFSVLPKVGCGELFDASNWVPTTTASRGVSPETQRSAQHGARRRGDAVSSMTQPEEERRDQEDDGRKQECQPVTHILQSHETISITSQR